MQEFVAHGEIGVKQKCGRKAKQAERAAPHPAYQPTAIAEPAMICRAMTSGGANAGTPIFAISADEAL